MSRNSPLSPSFVVIAFLIFSCQNSEEEFSESSSATAQTEDTSETKNAEPQTEESSGDEMASLPTNITGAYLHCNSAEQDEAMASSSFSLGCTIGNINSGYKVAISDIAEPGWSWSSNDPQMVVTQTYDEIHRQWYVIFEHPNADPDPISTVRFSFRLQKKWLQGHEGENPDTYIESSLKDAMATPYPNLSEFGKDPKLGGEESTPQGGIQ